MDEQARPTQTETSVKKPSRNTLLRVVLTTLLFLVPLGLFLALANAIRGNAPLAGDIAVLRAIHSLSSPIMDAAMVGITILGDASVVIPVIGITAGILFFGYKLRKQAVFLALATGGAAAINLIFKHIFQRTRPDLWEHLVYESSFSFPSGHAMISSSIALAVIILCWQTRWRKQAILGGISYCVLVSFSRLYLGVHFPSDVIAAWCVSALWVGIVYLVFKQFNLLPQKPQTTQA